MELKRIFAFLVFVIIGCNGNGGGEVVDGEDEEDIAGDEDGDFVEQVGCRSDLDCFNGKICDGEEKCVDGICMSGTPPDCNDNDDCTVDYCSEEENGCVHDLRDEDGDGYYDEACGGSDCNDREFLIHPGAEEQCNNIDDNCDDLLGQIEDNDGDGHASLSCGGDDCDDNDKLTFSEAIEQCDGKDNDCNEICDDGFECCQGEENISCLTPYNLEGIKFCTSDCTWSVCCSSTEMICNNNYDDNCNGVIDEYSKIGSDVRITNDPEHSDFPALQWTGSEFGIAWVDTREDINGEIYFARITSDGIKIGDNVRITNDPSVSRNPDLAWTGSEFGLVWSDGRTSASSLQIYFTKITRDGTKILGDLRITNTSSHMESPSLEWTGSEFGVASMNTTTDGQLYFNRIDINGNKIGGDIQIGYCGDASNQKPSLKWTGSEFDVAWAGGSGSVYQIYFARISSSGTRIGNVVSITVYDPRTGRRNYNPSLEWTGSEFSVIWSVDSMSGSITPGLYFIRITSDGNILSSETLIEAGGPRPTSLVWTGSEFGVGYSSWFFRLTSDGTKIGDTISGPWDGHSVEWTGSEYAVSWTDRRDGNAEIYFARIGCQ